MQIELIKKMLIDMARFYAQALDQRQIELYADVLSSFPIEQVLQAGKAYMVDSNNSRFPMPPHKIMDIYKPKQADSREVAVALARRIDKAVRDFGYNWAHGQLQGGETYYKGGGLLHLTFKDAVIAELGPLGWHAICSRGGWLSVRNSANEMDEGTFIAQMRDQIQASHNLEKQGFDVTKIEMPDKKTITHDASNSLLDAIGYKNKLEVLK